jgi:hypothetical protein
METIQVLLLDYSVGKCYFKTPEGAWGFVKWSRGKFHPRRGLERHRAAQLDRVLMQRAVVREWEVTTPPQKPVSFNQFWNAAHTKYMPLNLVLSRDDPDGIAIFSKQGDPIGTLSPQELDRMVEKLAKYSAKYRRWKEAEKQKLEEEG